MLKLIGTLMVNHSYTSTTLERHDDLVRAVRDLASRTSALKVARQFVRSIRSQEFKNWSALVSYSLASTLPEHEFVGPRRQCSTCGSYKELDTYQGELFNQLRSTGGVMIESLRYTIYDLNLFEAEADSSPTTDDRTYFDLLIKTLLRLPQKSSIKNADRELKHYMLSSFDRAIFLGTLGVCGVLSTPNHPGLWPHFVDFKNRADIDPGRYPYPACFWTREFGLNLAALEHFELAQFLSTETIRELTNQV